MEIQTCPNTDTWERGQTDKESTCKNRIILYCWEMFFYSTTVQKKINMSQNINIRSPYNLETPLLSIRTGDEFFLIEPNFIELNKHIEINYWFDTLTNVILSLKVKFTNILGLVLREDYSRRVKEYF